jgi:2-methylisocitrate lyase-like PEP mutase family enzyme
LAPKNTSLQQSQAERLNRRCGKLPNYQMISPGKNLHTALEEEVPLQVVGAINAYCALLAKSAGFRAIYLSGAGIANASLAPGAHRAPHVILQVDAIVF